MSEQQDRSKKAGRRIIDVVINQLREGYLPAFTKEDDNGVIEIAKVLFVDTEREDDEVDTEFLSLVASELERLNSESEIFERYIEFEEEHFLAGLSILSYFGTVLRQKNPDITAKIRIEQDGFKLRLVIDSKEGEKETVERILQDYGLVVRGRMASSDLLENPYHVQQLEMKLLMARNELEIARKQLDFQREVSADRIRTLEEDVKWLRGHVGNILQQGSKEKETLLELIYISQENGNSLLVEALSLVESILRGEMGRYSKDQIENALSTIRKESPNLFDRVKNFAFKATSSTAGRFLYDIILPMLPPA